MIELRGLRWFVAVIDAGQITSAAAKLGVSQPAVSQAIARLERQLGVTLLDRHPRGVSPTPAGAALLDQARHALTRLDDAISAARSARPSHL